LRRVPRLTGRDDVIAQIAALHPDLIVDLGDVSPRYADLAVRAQAATGSPAVLLDGSLRQTPQTVRTLAALLGRSERGEAVAHFAESVLAMAGSAAHRKVAYARGPDGSDLLVPGTLAGEVFDLLGWQLVAPTAAPEEMFHPSAIPEIAALDPDLLVLADPSAAVAIARAADWRAVRAVREHRILVAPSLPFGWIEEPPSLNRLAGVAWLSGQSADDVAQSLGAMLYGRPLTASEVNRVVEATWSAR
jgi:iron complex transport system substrate-binding protein